MLKEHEETDDLVAISIENALKNFENTSLESPNNPNLQ